MALQINQTLLGGVVAPVAYARIIEDRYMIQESLVPTDGIRILVAFYFNKAARDANEKLYVEAREYLMADKTKETREEKYIYLKTLPDFAGAIDV